MIDSLKNIIGKKVKRLFLVVWPPMGEECINQTDISAGYVLEESSGELYVITTDKNDLTKPMIECQTIPDSYFEWKEFEPRMVRWMNCEEGMELDTEYYEVSDMDIFKNINENSIIDVELVEISGDDTPIGIKVIFENDYILSTPINDGNTIETSSFNQRENLSSFLPLGKIEYRSLSRDIS